MYIHTMVHVNKIVGYARLRDLALPLGECLLRVDVQIKVSVLVHILVTLYTSQLAFQLL